MLKPGIYELLINRRVSEELRAIPAERKSTERVDGEEAADILSRYVADNVR